MYVVVAGAILKAGSKYLQACQLLSMQFDLEREADLTNYYVWSKQPSRELVPIFFANLKVPPIKTLFMQFERNRLRRSY